MSEVKTFFRHCPCCGRRFEIRLVSKQPADSQSVVGTETIRQAVGSLRPTIVEEHVPYLADIEDFRYSYRCKHCGHQWTEIHEKEELDGKPNGYEGD